MKLLKAIRKRLVLWWREVAFSLASRRLPGSYQHSDVPYFGQWESPELIRVIITRELSAAADPRWQESGAKTAEEYEQWTWNVCGMACLKMYLAATTGKIHPLLKLARNCQKYGGYVVREQEIDGLYYKPFVRFVRERFGVQARAVPLMTVGDIITALARGRYVIASVHPSIRFLDQPAAGKGGHLILVTGYDLDAGTLTWHNPSGFAGLSQAAVTGSLADFRRFFDNRGIVL